MVHSSPPSKPDPTQRVTKYFVAWKELKSDSLTELFAEDIHYVIRNKNVVIVGIHALRQYWERNAERQENLRLFWSIESLAIRHAGVRFTAYFHDTHEQLEMAITGRMEFYFDKEDKIVYFSECYQKLINSL